MGMLMRVAQGMVNVAWRATSPTSKALTGASPVSGHGGWWPVIREAWPGAWQHNIEIKTETILTNPAVFRCIDLICSDISKMPCNLVEVDSDGIWTEIEVPAFSPVLRRQNRYQNSIQFFYGWTQSKIIHGNTYVLKVRDRRDVVSQLYVLDPNLVMPLVAPDGSVYYELRSDNLTGIGDAGVTVPASEIIHDRSRFFYHPLVGVSPLVACGLAAVNGINIQQNSAKFFANASRPGGIITAPGKIDESTAQRLKTYWETEYRGGDPGKVAVLGDNLHYEVMAQTAQDSQLTEQLKFSAEIVAMAFGVPAYKLGLRDPKYDNIEALDAQYYSQCLQHYIESLERCLDDGLELHRAAPKRYKTMFDLDYLLMMDRATAVKTTADAIKAGFMSPNEARAKFDLKPVKGGDTPYLQQQNYSLSALDERDKLNPLATPGPNPQDGSEPPEGDEDGGSSASDGNAQASYRQQIDRAARRYERSAA